MGDVKALILAAGVGSRLRPLTDHLPKCLVPIGGRPLLDYWLDLLVAAGIERAMINTHAFPEQVRRHITRANRGGRIRITESWEQQLLGSAGTIAAHPELADGAEQVVVIYADNLSDVDLSAMLTFHRSHGDAITMLLFHAPCPSQCGIVELDSQGRVTSFIEKPARPISDLANGGAYVIQPDAYREMAAMRAFDLGFDVLPHFLGRMRGWIWSGYHLDIGTPHAYERAKTDAPALLKRRVLYKSNQKPAVFFDRDGTLIEHVHYLSNPAQVRLLPDAANSIMKLQAAGYKCVVVSNQSAIGRGIISTADLDRIHAEMSRQFAEQGVMLDGIYYCPLVPESDDRVTITSFDRKPGPGMLWRAANELGLDLSESWMVGDMVSDILAGANAQCRGQILVGTGIGLQSDIPSGLSCRVVDTLTSAVRHILEQGDASAMAAAPVVGNHERLSDMKGSVS